MKIKILAVKDKLLWYSDYIDYEFEVVREEVNCYWVYQPSDKWRLLNWVAKEDCKVL
jgi:hypothetical protein